MAITLRRLRKAKRMSQTTLAARAGLSRVYVARLENGARVNPSIGVVRALAAALRVPIVKLLE